jgi:hypothetical protein
LAYDPQACAFIIIEYKRDKNISVVDQGFTYLSLMLENKADFIVEYNEEPKATKHEKRRCGLEPNKGCICINRALPKTKFRQQTSKTLLLSYGK